MSSYLVLGPRDIPSARRTILFEDNHCLALAKHTGDLVQPDRTGDTCLADAAQAYLAHAGDKPGRAYLGVIHRLDRPVSGVVLFARTSKAAGRLARQFREREVQKTYWALVEGRLPRERSGRLEDRLLREGKGGTVKVASPAAAGARTAVLSYKVVARRPGRALLEIRLETGVKHQIRVQLAARGFPVAGDVRYGARPLSAGWIALHARRLTFTHPTLLHPVTVIASPSRRFLGLQKRWGLARRR